MEYKAKSIQVPAPAHAGVTLGVVGIRDSEWARQVDPAGRFLGGNLRVVDQAGTKVTDGSEPLMFPKSMAELSDD
jgi:hypothetical protein